MHNHRSSEHLQNVNQAKCRPPCIFCILWRRHIFCSSSIFHEHIIVHARMDCNKLKKNNVMQRHRHAMFQYFVFLITYLDFYYVLHVMTVYCLYSYHVSILDVRHFKKLHISQLLLSTVILIYFFPYFSVCSNQYSVHI